MELVVRGAAVAGTGRAAVRARDDVVRGTLDAQAPGVLVLRRYAPPVAPARPAFADTGCVPQSQAQAQSQSQTQTQLQRLPSALPWTETPITNKTSDQSFVSLAGCIQGRQAGSDE